MTTREEWLALAERCEKATGQDIAISADIATACSSWILEEGRFPSCPYYTGSLDAITALIERELPGATFKLGRDGTGAVYAQCAGKRIIEAAAPAIALCAAFCRAKAELAGDA